SGTASITSAHPSHAALTFATGVRRDAARSRASFVIFPLATSLSSCARIASTALFARPGAASNRRVGCPVVAATCAMPCPIVPVPRTAITAPFTSASCTSSRGRVRLSEIVQRIILIDDSPSARTLIGSKLREQGWEVDEAPDATTGAELAIASPPDAVVTDLWMPGISGLQLCRLLRAEPAPHQ